MAESILFDVAGSIITTLGSIAFEELGLILGVRDEFENLKDTVSTIQAVILDAEKRQSESHAVKDWLSKLKDALYDADDLMDEFSCESLRRHVMTKNEMKFKRVRIFFSESNQIVFRLKIGHKIKNLRQKFNVIDADRNRFDLSVSETNVRDDGLRKRPLADSFILENEVIGRDDDRKIIIDHLISTDITREKIPLISIFGMGGLGKTTLAQSIFNDERITRNFELKLWVCISEVFDLEDIVKKIIAYATNQTPEPHDMHLYSKLRTQIDGKKYLLILDDVWNDDYEKWVGLKRLLMGGAKGSKIVITTRSEHVAKTCDTTILYSLKGLSHAYSWLLFKQMAFNGEEEVENTNLIRIGKEIVTKLKGVPLAIRVIGRLLYYKNSEDDWLSFKDNELETVMQQENYEMISILKLSYNHLPSHLKQCFKYCSLFQKDRNISKDGLIRKWVAQGFIQPQGRNKPIEDIGNDYFMELLWRSFFQDITKNEYGDIEVCKMHEFIHDLACSVVENECVIADLDSGGIDKRTRHISFDSKLHKKLPEPLLVAKKLRTFLGLKYDLSLRPHSSIDYVNKIFTTFSKLRILSLHIKQLEELPKSIGKLKHLRYLDLSYMVSIEYLPGSITKLYNLETLILSSCWSLIELPRDIKNLINLRHLDLYGCSNLAHMPKGLGGLTSLQTMNLFVLGKNDGSMLNELNSLNNLKGELAIKGLEFCRIVDLQKNGNCLRLKTGLRELELGWDLAFEEEEGEEEGVEREGEEGGEGEEGEGEEGEGEGVLEYLQPHSNIEKISILSYHGRRLCNWLSSDSLARLVSLRFSWCRRLQHLPRFDQFPSLKNLDLKRLDCIEYIVDNDSSSSLTLFPSLEYLKIVSMPKLKGLYKSEISAQTSVLIPTFPRLTQLEIGGFGELIGIPWHPPLQSLKLKDVSVQAFDMVMKMTTNFVEDPSSALLQLKRLSLVRIKDFEVLPEEFFGHLTNLEFLEIRECHNLQLCFSGDDDDETWKKLVSLRSLRLVGLPKMQPLPKGLQCLTNLGHFVIEDCQNLRSLPEWLCNLTSLSNLEIRSCPELTSLPEGIHHLSSLSHMYIGECHNITSLPERMDHLRSLQKLFIVECPKLKERCKEETGEDWPKISHVPCVHLP